MIKVKIPGIKNVDKFLSQLRVLKIMLYDVYTKSRWRYCKNYTYILIAKLLETVEHLGKVHDNETKEYFSSFMYKQI